MVMIWGYTPPKSPEEIKAESKYHAEMDKNREERKAREQFLEDAVGFFNDWGIVLDVPTSSGDLYCGFHYKQMMDIRVMAHLPAHKRYELKEIECTYAPMDYQCINPSDNVTETFVPERTVGTGFGAMELRSGMVPEFYMGLMAETMLKVEELIKESEMKNWTLTFKVNFSDMTDEEYLERTKELYQTIPLFSK